MRDILMRGAQRGRPGTGNVRKTPATRRPGASLVWVLAFGVLAAAVLSGMLLLLSWSHDSAASSSWRFGERTRLSSMTRTGRRWLQMELEAGRLPRGKYPGVPVDFSSLRIFHHDEEDGASVDVYDLDYDSAAVPDSAWRDTDAAGRFFPACQDAYLVRAAVPAEDGPAMVLEAVFVARGVELPDGSRAFVLETAPILWQELWL